MVESKKAQLKEKFAEEDFPIHVIARHMDLTDAMKSYSIDKLLKIKRFGLRIVEVTIVMNIERIYHHVDYIVLVNNTKIKVSGQSDSMYASIDLAIQRLENKLRRYHEKICDHHGVKYTQVDMNVNVVRSSEEDINDLIEEENLKHPSFETHQVVSQETLPLKTLTQSEAIMKMDLSGDRFLIYTGEEDKKLKVIYRRNDGNYGIIEVQK